MVDSSVLVYASLIKGWDLSPQHDPVSSFISCGRELTRNLELTYLYNNRDIRLH